MLKTKVSLRHFGHRLLPIASGGSASALEAAVFAVSLYIASAGTLTFEIVVRTKIPNGIPAALSRGNYGIHLGTTCGFSNGCKRGDARQAENVY